MPFLGDHLIDLVPIVILALLFFGPKRLPEMGSAIGKTITEFRKSMKEASEPAATTPAVPTAQAPAQLTPPTTPVAPTLPTATVEPAKTAQD